MGCSCFDCRRSRSANRSLAPSLAKWGLKGEVIGVTGAAELMVTPPKGTEEVRLVAASAELDRLQRGDRGPEVSLPSGSDGLALMQVWLAPSRTPQDEN